MHFLGHQHPGPNNNQSSMVLRFNKYLIIVFDSEQSNWFDVCRLVNIFFKVLVGVFDWY